MSKNDELLVQDEIDALLHSVSGGDQQSGPEQSKNGDKRVSAFDPNTQHRVIRDRLHSLEIINARFARLFRLSLFNLIRRNPDITVSGVEYHSFSAFSRNVPMPANINVIGMKPLRGSALVVFPPSMVFMVVDSLFGGDGRFLTKSEGRDFTNTEQRVIKRLLTLATDAYQESWQATYPLEISHLRSEMQARFANITNSPNEIVVNSTFHLEVGGLSTEFQVCMPYTMIEPIKELLTNPLTESQGKQESNWGNLIAGQLQDTNVNLKVDFTSINSRIGDVTRLKVGDILPLQMPEEVTAGVNGVPVLDARFGLHNGHRALRVSRLRDHTLNRLEAAGKKGPSFNNSVEEPENDK